MFNLVATGTSLTEELSEPSPPLIHTCSTRMRKGFGFSGMGQTVPRRWNLEVGWRDVWRFFLPARVRENFQLEISFWVAIIPTARCPELETAATFDYVSLVLGSFFFGPENLGVHKDL